MSSHSIQLAKALRVLQNVRNIQGTAGNWNFSPYMHGYFNGIELAMSIMQDREPVFKNEPIQYLEDGPVIHPLGKPSISENIPIGIESELQIKDEKKLQAENAKLRECVEWYSNFINYSNLPEYGPIYRTAVFSDMEEINEFTKYGGKRARQVLKELNKGESK